MNDVELLREAARLMRERAEAATPGPWVAHPDGLVWPGPAIPGDPVSGSTLPEDAAHIASWHPAVALAVADWLESAASGFEYLPPRRRDQQALTVARAYLGGAR